MALIEDLPKMSFMVGFRNDVKNALAARDNRNLFYMAGSNIVVLNFETMTQAFLRNLPIHKNITSIAICPARRFIAVAERPKPKASVYIYDLKLLTIKRIIPYGEPYQSIEALAFSANSKMLLMCVGEPDSHVVYWQWETKRIVAKMKLTYSRDPAFPIELSISVADDTVVCMTFNNIVKTFYYNDGKFKQFGMIKMNLPNIHCHSWLDNKIIVLLCEDKTVRFIQNAAQILVFHLDTYMQTNTKKQSFVQTVDYENPQNISPTQIGQIKPAFLVTPDNNGFLVSIQDQNVYYFQKIDQENALDFRLAAIFSIPSKGFFTSHESYISSLTLSPGGIKLFAATTDKQIYMVDFKDSFQREIFNDDPLEINMVNVLFDFPSQSVVAMDICRLKPLIVTACADRCVRIFNYEKRELELIQGFPEESFSAAFHPSGNEVLIGFSDRLRLMNVLIDSLQTMKEFNYPSCLTCTFSFAGHLFAISKGGEIEIVCVATSDVLHKFRSHTAQVSQITFRDNDRYLFSCGRDGGVFGYDLYSGNRVLECVNKKITYLSMAVTSNHESVFVVDNENKVTEISNHQVINERLINQRKLTSVILIENDKKLCIGTEDGAILIIVLPLSATVAVKSYRGHSQPITSLCVAFTNLFLFSSSVDGSIIVWSLRNTFDGKSTIDTQALWSKEYFVRRTDWEDKVNELMEKETELDDLKLENAYNLRHQELKRNEDFSEVTKLFIKNIEILKNDNKILLESKEKTREYMLEELETCVQNHLKEMQDLKKQYEEKNAELTKELSALKITHQNAIASFNEHKGELIEAHTNALQELQDYMDLRILERGACIAVLQQERLEEHMAHEQEKKLIEEDADREILEIKTEYERLLCKEKQINNRLRGDSSMLNERFNSLTLEIANYKLEIEKFSEELDHYKQTIEEKNKYISELKKEIQERDDAIATKENHIVELKNQNQELEKHKFVLNYRNKNLNNMVLPKDSEIRSCRDQIREMEIELSRSQGDNCKLRQNLVHLRLKNNHYKKEIQRLRQTNHCHRTLHRRVQSDIRNCSNKVTDKKELKKSVLTIHDKYVLADDDLESNDEETENIAAVNKQNEFLNKMVANLRKNLNNNIKFEQRNRLKIVQDNMDLIKEINDLRTELHNARAKIKVYATELKLKKGLTEEMMIPRLPGERINAALQLELDEKKRLLKTQRRMLNSLYDERKVSLNEKSPGASPNNNNSSTIRLPPLEGTAIK